MRDRRRCQFKAACDRDEEMDYHDCPCWRCQEWARWAQTPAYREAIIEGISQAASERVHQGTA